MRDYLKFLAASLAGAVAIAVAMKSPSAATIVAGLTVGGFVMYRGATHAAAYAIWLLSVIASNALLRELLNQAAAENPEKYTQDDITTALGVWLVIGAIVLHPMCYWAGRVAVPFGRKLLRMPEHKSSLSGSSQPVDMPIASTARLEELRRRRYWVLRFIGAFFVVMILGKVIEGPLGIERLPYERYVVLAAIVVGIAYVAILVRRKNSEPRG